MQTVFEALKKSGIDYTLVVSNAFFSYALPRLGQLGPPPVPETVSVYAGGNTRGARSVIIRMIIILIIMNNNQYY